MEVQILRFFLNLFSLFVLIPFLFYSVYVIGFKKINEDAKIITIPLGSNVSIIKNDLIDLNKLDKYFLGLTLKLSSKFNKIHYGQFYINEKITFLQLIKILTNYSNIDHKITLIEGWQEYQISDYLRNFFKEEPIIKYENFIADSFIVKSANSFEELAYLMNLSYDRLFKKNTSKLMDKFSEKEIMIIASLVAKEAVNDDDKKLVSSVIINRIEKKMKLQIDATVIYALTEGKKKFDRKLTYKDLKIKHPFNTYYIKGLPPSMISIVNTKTIEIVLENYKTDFLYYFFNHYEKLHIYSKTFKEHKRKLNEYRKKNK